ncbi:MAG: HEAT repeat domain-containing protein, partial [Pseudomonadota bacterium]
MSRLLSALFFLPFLLVSALADDDLQGLIDALATGKLKDRTAQIEAITATGDVRVVPTLQALQGGTLYYRKSDKKVFLTREDGSDFTLIEPLTGQEAGTAAKKEFRKVKVNNRLRRLLSAEIGSMTLESPDSAVRLAAAQSMYETADPGNLDALEQALSKETDPDVREAMQLAQASTVLKTEADDKTKITAVEILGTAGGRSVLPLLRSLTATPGLVAEAAQKEIAGI